MFSPFDLPSGILLLVTDQLSSPADFVLHRGLVDHLKGAKSEIPTKKVIMLSVSEGITRWKAIAAKSNLHLDQQSASGGFVFIGVLERVSPADLDPNDMPVLRPILDAVTSALGGNDELETLVIVDDLATLDWLGFSVLDITRFCRALAAACRKAKATLLIRQHVLTPSTAEPVLDDLFRALHQMCTYHMEVLPLASGRSGAVSGQAWGRLVVGYDYSEGAQRCNTSLPTGAQYFLSGGREREFYSTARWYSWKRRRFATDDI